MSFVDNLYESLCKCSRKSYSNLCEMATVGYVDINGKNVHTCRGRFGFR